MGIDNVEGAVEPTAATVDELRLANQKLAKELAVANGRLSDLQEVIRGLFAWRDATTRAKALNGYWDSAAAMLPEATRETK